MFEINMTEVFIGLLVLVGGGLYLFTFTKRGYNKYSYKKVSLFSPSEKFFYFALKKALKDKYIIFAKVRIADVIKPASTMNKKQWWKAFVQISSKHFDFVLCRKHDLKVLCAIELNDKSHQVRERKKRDFLVKHICNTSQMPIIWVSASKSYDAVELLSLVEKHIKD